MGGRMEGEACAYFTLSLCHRDISNSHCISSQVLTPICKDGPFLMVFPPSNCSRLQFLRQWVRSIGWAYIMCWPPGKGRTDSFQFPWRKACTLYVIRMTHVGEGQFPLMKSGCCERALMLNSQMQKMAIFYPLSCVSKPMTDPLILTFSQLRISIYLTNPHLPWFTF